MNTTLMDHRTEAVTARGARMRGEMTEPARAAAGEHEDRTPVVREHDLADILQSFNDVTERLKRSHETLGREVRRLREQLSEKDRELERRRRLAALGEMAAGVAHEIRNPLGGIGLYASLLARDLSGDAEKYETAQRILRGVRSLEAIVGDILMFAGGVEPRRQCVPLGKIIDEVAELTAPQMRLHDIVWHVADGARKAVVFVDQQQISRALLNLVLNAFDAVGNGGRVSVSAASGREGFVELKVEDDGPGIAPEILDRVFNPFFTTKDHGTGLGLSIVHRIVEAHGGHVMAANRPEGGACFVMELPVFEGPRA